MVALPILFEPDFGSVMVVGAVGFLLMFVGVLIWNLISPWPEHWWGYRYFITALLIPIIVGVVSTVWFMTGGIRDIIRLFRDLEKRTANYLDDGRVEGSMSLADKAQLEEVDAGKKDDK